MRKYHFYWGWALIPCIGLLSGCGKGDKANVDKGKVQVEEKAANSPAKNAPTAEGVLTLIKSTKVADRKKALLQVAKMDADDTELLNGLVEALKDPTSAPLGDYFPNEPFSAREAAVMALMQWGAAGEKILIEKGAPALREGLKDSKPNVREHTAHAITAMGAKGKPLADALIPLCSDKVKEVRQATYRALEKMKPIPPAAIIRLLSNPEPEIASDAAETLTWIKPTAAEVPALIEAIKNPELAQKSPEIAFTIRNVAAEALGGLASDAQPAIPALIEIVKNTDEMDLLRSARPTEAGHMLALRRIGKASVPALIPLLKDPKPIVRWQAAAILGGIGSNASDALPELQTALETEQTLMLGRFYVVAECAMAQMQIGGDATKAVEVVTKLLKNPDPVVRTGSARVLSRMGRKATSALPALIELLSDEDNATQLMAVEAISSMGPSAKSAVPELVKKLDNPEPMVQRRLVDSLRGIGPQAAAAVPALAKLLESKDDGVRSSVMDTLAAIGPEAKDAVGKIEPFLAPATSLNERTKAIETLAAIGPGAKAALPTLLNLTTEKTMNIRSSAAVSAAKIGPGNAEVVAMLTRLLKDSQTQVRITALRALGSMGPTAKAAIPDLKTMTEKTKDLSVQVWVAAVLVSMNSESEANAKIVLDALKSKVAIGKLPRLAAIDAVEFLGAHAKAAIPELIEALKDRTLVSNFDTTQVRERAAKALGRLGPAAKDAIPKLADLVRDGDVPAKRAAIESLGQIGPLAIYAAPRLRDITRSDPRLAGLALEALQKIDITEKKDLEEKKDPEEKKPE